MLCSGNGLKASGIVGLCNIEVAKSSGLSISLDCQLINAAVVCLKLCNLLAEKIDKTFSILMVLPSFS